MNHLRQCLRCWIPASKKKVDGPSVHDVDEMRISDPDQSSISSSHNDPQSLPVRVRCPSSATSVNDDASPVAAATECMENGVEEAENYIALDKCFSGSRPSKVQTMPKLVQRDIHLLDLVPPSPCSLMENVSSLSGMPEVYAPMSSCKISSRTPRGSLGGIGSRVVDSPSKIQQITQQGIQRDLFLFEAKTLETQAGSNQSLKSDIWNNNSLLGTRDEHGLRVCHRPELRDRILCTSISSNASSAVENRTFYPSNEMSRSLHDSPSGHTDHPHYCNICTNPDDDVISSQNFRLDGAVEFSETDVRWNLNDGISKGHDCQSEEAFKILHMTPPAPTDQKNKLKMHKYVNAWDGAGLVHGAAANGIDHPCRTVRNCPEESVVNDWDGYYNILSTNSHSSKTEHATTYSPSSTPPPPPPPPPSCQGHSGPRRKLSKPKTNPCPKHPHRRDSVILPVRRKSTNDGDSSSSDDEVDSYRSISPADSNASLSNKFIHSFPFNGFTSRPPPPPQQPSQSIEYLQLDLDQPINGSRGSPNAIHRVLNSVPIDYIKIDPFRTKALSEAKRQFESNRQNGKISH